MRGFDMSGNEVGSGYQVNLWSVTNAAPVMLLGMSREDYERVRMIEIYERESPLTAAGPFPWMRSSQALLTSAFRQAPSP